LEAKMSDVIEALFPEELVPTAEAVRARVLALVPEAKEKLRAGWGVLGFDAPKYFAFLGVYQDRVRLGFQRGPWLSDPNGLLEGEGSYVRWILFSSPRDVYREGVSELIRQAVEERAACAVRASGGVVGRSASGHVRGKLR
jgi:hypothetical protein